MSTPSPSEITPADLFRVLRQYRWRWIVPSVVCPLLAAVFALVKPESWEASQALIVRNEATAAGEEPGKFRHPDDMKTIQETILEIAKSSAVLRKTLEVVGPEADQVAVEPWPSAQDIEDLESALKIVPPKGAEFGKTEIFYLKVKARTASRALKLAGELSKQVQIRCQKLREAKAESMMTELEKAVAQASDKLQEATGRLSQCEQQVGSDLGELRMLQGSPSGESELRRRLVEVDHELREASTAQRVSQELLELLSAAQDDPGRLLATPNRLLESQPALKRLKDGLVDAQLRTAELRGTMSEDHPKVRSARAAELEVGRHIHDELAVAIKGVQVEVRLTAARVDQLEGQLADVDERLDRLAALRADYANLVAEVEHRSKLYEQAERSLNDARASREGALAISLIDAVDAPDTGSKPAGPGGTILVAGGLAGGLALGAAILFLTVPGLRPEEEEDEASLAAPRLADSGEPANEALVGAGQFAPDPAAALEQALHKLALGGGRR